LASMVHLSNSLVIIPSFGNAKSVALKRQRLKKLQVLIYSDNLPYSHGPQGKFRGIVQYLDNP